MALDGCGCLMYITRFRDTVNSTEELDTGSVVIVVSTRPILFNRNLSLIKQATGSGRHLQMGDAVMGVVPGKCFTFRRIHGAVRLSCSKSTW